MISHRDPVQCIIPPHMTRKLAESKDPSVRARALQSLAMSSRIRGRRDVLSAIAIPARGNQGKHRTIFDAGGGTNLPGSQVRDEGDPPTGDPAADEAYDGLGATYDLYDQVFGRDSLDDKGMRLIASVHFGQNFDNAEFDGQQMLFGDGDGQFFNRFTVAVDVIGHELTYGVTQFTANLEYHDQSGALNESFSDVFGSLVKQHANGQDAASADWLIGLGIFTDQVQSGDPSRGAALRSMLHPGTGYNDPVFGKDPQPDNMRGFIHTHEDNGGVHLNSGIPNRAFALTALAIGGNAWEDAGMIWYKTLLRLPSTAQFQDAADATFQVAGELFTSGSSQQQAVLDAWAQVGIRVSSVSLARGRARRASAGTVARTNGASNGGDYHVQIEKLTSELKKLTDLVNKSLVSSKK
jgi:Zn-dependent metalloprotease